MQLDFFQSSHEANSQERILEQVSRVDGLKMYFEFIDSASEESILAQVDQLPWLGDLKRRVQHYGYKYDYSARRIDPDTYLGPLPAWLQTIARKLVGEEVLSFYPDQAIINEYLPGQGISSHIDCQPCFGETIVSLSLGSRCIMNFEPFPGATEKISLMLEPRSLIVLTGSSRYNWYHSIPARKTDEWLGQRIERFKRVSVTFRKVILTQEYKQLQKNDSKTILQLSGLETPPSFVI